MQTSINGPKCLALSMAVVSAMLLTASPTTAQDPPPPTLGLTGSVCVSFVASIFGVCFPYAACAKVASARRAGFKRCGFHRFSPSCTHTVLDFGFGRKKKSSNPTRWLFETLIVFVGSPWGAAVLGVSLFT